MVLCKYSECTNKISKIIGHCKECNKNFCCKHRHIETHNCPKLSQVKYNIKQNLINKLKKDAIYTDKLIKI